MAWIGWVGVALIGAAAVVALAGMAAVVPRGLRLRRTVLETRRLVEMYRQAINTSIAERGELAVEREWLLRPLRRAGRVARHPLAIALIESFRLRRRRARVVAE